MALVKVNWRPDAAALRGFGWIATGVCLALGAWARYRHTLFRVELDDAAAARAQTILWVGAGVIFLLALTAPRLLRPVYLLLTVVTLPIGFVVSYLVMGLLFFGVITPLGLAMRAFGRDPLRRSWDKAAPTYWSAKEPRSPPARYFRQS